jgi:hypothetical protein
VNGPLDFCVHGSGAIGELDAMDPLGRLARAEPIANVIELL